MCAIGRTSRYMNAASQQLGAALEEKCPPSLSGAAAKQTNRWRSCKNALTSGIPFHCIKVENLHALHFRERHGYNAVIIPELTAFRNDPVMQKKMYCQPSYVLSAPSISLGLLKFRCGVFSLNRRAWVQASALDFLSSGMASLSSLNRKAWVQELPRLGFKSTQRRESSHPAVKEPYKSPYTYRSASWKDRRGGGRYNSHIRVRIGSSEEEQPPKYWCEQIILQDLTGYVTHQAIELVHRELIAPKQWVFLVQDEVSQEPSGNICENGRQLPKQYGLPCKFWLYRSVVADLPIPLSLLHSRWLIRAPEIVVGWQMKFNLSITPASYALLDDIRGQSSTQLDNEDDRPPPPTSVQSRYDGWGLDMMKAEAFEAYELHKNILEGHRAEDYARELTKEIQKMNRTYNEKYTRPSLV